MDCHLQIDADPVPDPAYHFDADPDPDFYLMRSGSGFLFDADADPGYQNDADPDTQHCLNYTVASLVPPVRFWVRPPAAVAFGPTAGCQTLPANRSYNLT